MGVGTGVAGSCRVTGTANGEDSDAEIGDIVAVGREEVGDVLHPTSQAKHTRIKAPSTTNRLVTSILLKNQSNKHGGGKVLASSGDIPNLDQPHATMESYRCTPQRHHSPDIGLVQGWALGLR